MTPTQPAPGAVAKIHIMGGPGSGKTVLAAQLARIVGAQVVHLDEVARIGGGIGPERSLDDQLRAIREILAQPGWVTEGVHLGWTMELLTAADVVVWLDYVDGGLAARRIIRRFLASAVEEMHRQPGLRKVIRFRDYLYQLRGLLRAIPETLRYYRTGADHDTKPTDRESRALAAAGLRSGDPKLVHCREANDLRRFIYFLEQSTAANSPSDRPNPFRSSR